MQINIHVISFDQKSFCFNDVHLEDNHYGYCNEQTLVGFQIISLTCRSSEVKVEVLPVQITCMVYVIQILMHIRCILYPV